MLKRETISQIRFGYGLGESGPVATSVDALVSEARQAARVKPRLTLRQRAKILQTYRDARKADTEAAKKTARQKLVLNSMDDLRFVLQNAVGGPGFGERLVQFWGDHFTVAAKGPVLRVLVPDVIERAVRPNVAGRFSDMLRAVTLHPGMLIYLNQVQSFGPNSRAGKRQGKGLNENLAREILELHTLGVASNYSQADVRGFANLLTGLSADRNGFKFRNGLVEPGRHTVLGRTYDGKLPGIEQALEDIALHPDTARHLATKLITHFIGGKPDTAHVEQIAQAYLNSDGNLARTYSALLDHPNSWSEDFQKAKTPFDFIVSAFRAAGATKDDIVSIKPKDLRNGVVGAMQLMGQQMFVPPGPDGWDEVPETWITPPGLAARIRWAVGFSERIQDNHDPRTFLERALADAATPLLQFAVAGSESRVEGLALTLVSPEFNRR
ncbi:MAG: DUF1800 domain-containing protein [Silicimonas sp.]|nr:DUF1800 domain-containing protein [Silicimonas sp.]